VSERKRGGSFYHYWSTPRVEMISKQAAKNPKLAAGMSYKSLSSKSTGLAILDKFKNIFKYYLIKNY